MTLSRPNEYGVRGGALAWSGAARRLFISVHLLILARGISPLHLLVVGDLALMWLRLQTT